MPEVKHPPVLDISHWIDVPDFCALEPLPWLILTKATEGTTLLDAKVADYADAIRDAGIRLGLFHFMRPGDEVEQANWFSEIVGTLGLQGDELLACDMEVTGIRLDQVKRFLDIVQAWTAIRPIVYSSQLLLESLYPNGICPEWLKGEWLWIAEYPPAPDLTNEIPSWIVPRGCLKERIALWQYTDDGILGGIPGNNVDLNLINPLFMQAIGLKEPNTMPDYLFSITPYFSDGCSVRPEPDTGNTKILPGLPFGKYAYGNRKLTIAEDKWENNVQVNAAGDIWLEVLEVNGVAFPQPAYIAEIHLGKRYATIRQIGTIPAPAPTEEIVITQTFTSPGYVATTVVNGNVVTTTLKPE